MRVVVMNNRGSNDVPLSTPKLYSGGYTDDLNEVVQHVKQKLPSAPIVGIGMWLTIAFNVPLINVLQGFSLGANILAKYVGEKGRDNVDSGLLAAVAISTP